MAELDNKKYNQADFEEIQTDFVALNFAYIRWVSLRKKTVSGKYIHSQEGNQGKTNDSDQKTRFAAYSGNNRHLTKLKGMQK
jgi:hypothetical protein